MAKQHRNSTTSASGGSRNGSTLVELLAVLVVLSVLAGVAVLRPGLRESRERAELARLRIEARQLRQAQEVFRGETGRYYTGSLTAAATRTADFAYTPPPSIRIVVETAEPDHWVAQLALYTNAEPSSSGHSCKLSLTATNSDQAACTPIQGWESSAPPTSTGAGSPDGDSPAAGD